MSEKRFIVDDDGIYDNQEKKHFKFVAYDWIDCDIYECCDLLNEQQATNDYLEESNSRLQVQLGETLRLVDKLKEENEQLRQENVRLKDDAQYYKTKSARLEEELLSMRQELQKKQEEEKLYAREIVELNKTKNEMLNFKELGGDY